MKTVLRAIAFLLILCMCFPLLPVPIAQAASPSTVSVMSYNLKNTNYGFGGVASMVTESGADIVGMQEVNTLQYLGINSAMEKAGFSVTMGKSTGFGDNWESDEYLPIYYKADKYKDYAHGTLWLSDTPTEQSQFADSAYLRIVNWACYEIIGTSDYILVFNTHLDFGIDLQIRQLNVILEAMVAQTSKYFKAKNHVILLGDLNCANTSQTMMYLQGDSPYSQTKQVNTYIGQKLDEARQIADVTTANSFGNYYTQPSEGPTMDLDHIYVSHKGFHCQSYSVLSNAAGSDHLPIIAKLQFKTESAHINSYRYVTDGRHKATCNTCGYSVEGACTYDGEVCTLCGSGRDLQTFRLVKSMDELSTGRYLMIMQATGAYPGTFPYYAATVYPDACFNATETKSIAFPSLPEEITLEPEQQPSLVWHFTGDATGIVIGDASGNALNHKDRDMYLNKETPTVWVPDYSTGAGHFAIRENNTYFLSLRTDLNTIGKTGGDGPMFGTVNNTSTGNYKIFLYKETETESEPELPDLPDEPELPDGELVSGRYVIAANVDGTYYAMGNAFASKITGTPITVTDGCVSATDAKDAVINLTSTENGWTIDDGNGNYLKYANSTNLGKSSSEYYWNISEGVNGTWRATPQAEGRGLVYRAGTYCRFGAYALSNVSEGDTEYFDIEFLPVEGDIETDTPNVPELPEEPELPEDPAIPFVQPTEGRYVIAVKIDGIYYGMSNSFENKIPGIPISLTDGKVDPQNAEGLAINLTAVGDGFTIDDGAGNYLKYNSSTNLGKSDSSYVWTFSQGVKGTYRATSLVAERGLIYRAGTYNRFGGYAVSNVKEKGTEYFDIELLQIGELPEPEILDVKINHSLNLASDISINYAVASTALSDYSKIYMDVTVPVYEGNTKTGISTVTIYPILKGNYYYFTMSGITAPQMNDTLEATVHATKDGICYVSAVDTYSVATYAYNQLKANANANLVKLCAELLRYGGKSQTYKAYRTDALADGNMTDAYKANLTNLDDVIFGNTNSTLNDLTAPTVTWVGKSLLLDSKVTLRMIANLSNYTGDISDLSVQVTYTNLEGETVTAIVKDCVVYNLEKKQYAFDFAGLRAAEIRTVLSAAVYNGNTRVSPTLQYSMDTYGNNKSGDLLAVCQALVAYSDAALAFFRG